MDKYQNLHRHLRSLETSEWAASFTEIEKILKFPLPASARSYPAWWSNQADGGHSQGAAWQSAGWRTGNLNLRDGKVTFFRTRRQNTQTQKRPSAAPAIAEPVRPAARSAAAEPAREAVSLTLAQAKAGLARHFGVKPESIEITIRG